MINTFKFRSVNRFPPCAVKVGEVTALKHEVCEISSCMQSSVAFKE